MKIRATDPTPGTAVDAQGTFQVTAYFANGQVAYDYIAKALCVKVSPKGLNTEPYDLGKVVGQITEVRPGSLSFVQAGRSVVIDVLKNAEGFGASDWVGQTVYGGDLGVFVPSVCATPYYDGNIRPVTQGQIVLRTGS